MMTKQQVQDLKEAQRKLTKMRSETLPYIGNSRVRSIGANVEQDPRKRNTHDPHDMYRWSRTSRWVKPLLAIGVCVAAITVVTFVWMLTVIVFL